MADTMKLLPCPFCGENAQVSRRMGYAFSFCGKCHAEGPTSREDADHAAKAWNRRASPPAREEAPADPCASHKAEGFSLDPCCPHCEAPVEGARDWQATIDRIVPVIAPMDAIEASEFCCEHTLLLDRTRIRRELAALRNRTSEPEAGEPVGATWKGLPGYSMIVFKTDHVAAGTALYIHPAPSESDDRLRVFGEHTNWDLSYRYGEDGEDGAWLVQQINGGINDREWTKIGSGDTPSDAIDQALAALTEGGKD